MSNDAPKPWEQHSHKNTNLYEASHSLVHALEHRLREQGYWSDIEPSAQALASQAPFCCDTLRFEQWLQFVFIPKMRLLIDSQQPLPKAMQLQPMAEISWGEKANPALVAALLAFDQLYSKDR
ncbi:YqcC family protein [Aliiglaciecola sp. CAU 1673]|uniref:YqcC family protein n=1 Tax=Aliiglaciecola sp. CAU 1673 TaxID=3032595 RepID=UPI0023D9C799|nr:YqcC family protein [Aliiglaciecola sp. CAU 1673]MDF2179631.1 YqcC family protein [Aliiglaciecola sp. CAU 1673]